MFAPWTASRTTVRVSNTLCRWRRLRRPWCGGLLPRRGVPKKHKKMLRVPSDAIVRVQVPAEHPAVEAACRTPQTLTAYMLCHHFETTARPFAEEIVVPLKLCNQSPMYVGTFLVLSPTTVTDVISANTVDVDGTFSIYEVDEATRDVRFAGRSSLDVLASSTTFYDLLMQCTPTTQMVSSKKKRGRADGSMLGVKFARSSEGHPRDDLAQLGCQSAGAPSASF